MTYRAVKKAGLAHLIDTRYAGRAVGVAGVSCRVLGRIPARTVSLVLGSSGAVVDRSPSICVLEEGIGEGNNGDGVELLLGLDAMEDWSAGICLRDRTLTIRCSSSGSSRMATRNSGSSAHSEVDDLVIPFMNGGSVPCCAPIRNKDTSHHRQHPHEIYSKSHRTLPMAVKKRTIISPPPSPSVPWVINSQRMPTADLESDLDLLDSTNSGVVRAYGMMDRSGDYDDDDTWEDDGDDDEYFESDHDYDGCNLSGI